MRKSWSPQDMTLKLNVSIYFFLLVRNSYIKEFSLKLKIFP